jgi:hypothetical protein
MNYMSQKLYHLIHIDVCNDIIFVRYKLYLVNQIYG